MLFLNPVLTSVIKRVQNVLCQACELTVSNVHGYCDVRSWIFFTKNISITSCNWGQVAWWVESLFFVVVFPRVNSSTGHKLILPLGYIGLNSAVPRSHSQFEEQLPILVTRKSFVSKFPNQTRVVCDRRACLYLPLVQDSYWVGISVCTPEITNNHEDQCWPSFVPAPTPWSIFIVHGSYAEVWKAEIELFRIFWVL